MPYELTWYASDKVLLLKIDGNYTISEAREANQQIIDILNQRENSLSLLIDATTMSRPHNFTEIRVEQTFMNHSRLKYISIVTSDRLVKLSMMVIFNLCRAIFHIHENMNNAEVMLKHHGQLS